MSRALVWKRDAPSIWVATAEPRDPEYEYIARVYRTPHWGDAWSAILSCNGSLIFNDTTFASRDDAGDGATQAMLRAIRINEGP